MTVCGKDVYFLKPMLRKVLIDLPFLVNFIIFRRLLYWELAISFFVFTLLRRIEFTLLLQTGDSNNRAGDRIPHNLTFSAKIEDFQLVS